MTEKEAIERAKAEMAEKCARMAEIDPSLLPLSGPYGEGYAAGRQAAANTIRFMFNTTHESLDMGENDRQTRRQEV